MHLLFFFCLLFEVESNWCLHSCIAFGVAEVARQRKIANWNMNSVRRARLGERGESMGSRTNLWAGSNPIDCMILNIQNYWIKYDMSNEVEINFQIKVFCGCWNRFGLQAATSVHVLTIIWQWGKFRYVWAKCVGLTVPECVRELL